MKYSENKPIPGYQAAGFTLIEVLIALVILSIGLLGIAGMMGFSQKANDSAYMRTQATFFAYDIIDKMRANQTAALNGDYDTGFSTQISSPPNCVGSSNSCSSTSLAQYDLSQWKQRLASTANGLPCGEGQVTLKTINGLSQITVTIQWDDSRAQSAASLGSLKASSPGNCSNLTSPLKLQTVTVL